MSKVVASLAAVLCVAALAACGEDGAEPGASQEATLVLDFRPNAVHTGIYASLADGAYERRGIDLEIQEPSASTDAPKLLETGRAQFAILDVHDLAIARERGLDLVAVYPIVQRPLAAVIAADRRQTREPADLSGGEVGVTGLPSDEAVLDSVLRSDGADPASVDRVTIGFDAVPALSAGRLEAATAFWNAEGVTLRGAGVPTREFRVDDYGAPRYPELVLVTGSDLLAEDPELVHDVWAATTTGYEQVVDNPHAALEDLLTGAEGLERPQQAAQLGALTQAGAFTPLGSFDRGALRDWAAWDLEHGIVSEPIDVDAAFADPGELG